MSCTLDEAASLMLGEKLLVTSLDVNSLQDFKQALNKISAVIDRSDKDNLSSLDADIEVLPTDSHFSIDDVSRHAQDEHDSIVAALGGTAGAGRLNATGISHCADT